MAKALDAVKKIPSARFERPTRLKPERELRPAPAPAEDDKKTARLVDGLKAVKFGRAMAAVFHREKSAEDAARQAEEARLEQAVKRQAEARRALKEEERQYRFDQARVVRERARKEKEAIKLEEARQRQAIVQAEREARERERAEAERKRQERIRLEEERLAADRLAEESRRIEEDKRRWEIYQIKLAQREKRRLLRRRAFKKAGLVLRRRGLAVYSAVKNNLVFSLACLIFGGLAAYLILVLAVLRLDYGSKIAAALAQRLPAPAALTSQGVIDYRQYRQIKNSLALLPAAERKNRLIEWQIEETLKRKYGLAAGAAPESLAVKFAADEDYNQVGLARIRKISELKQSGLALKQLEKYADDYGAAGSGARAKAASASASTGLSAGQTGGLAYAPDGYYLWEKNPGAGLEYVFAAARPLDQYLAEKIKTGWVLVLADF